MCHRLLPLSPSCVGGPMEKKTMSLARKVADRLIFFLDGHRPHLHLRPTQPQIQLFPKKTILIYVLFHFILQYTSLNSLGDKVLVIIKDAEKKSAGDWCPVVYSKYAGTEVEFNGSNHLILKEDDIVGILETEDVMDLKPLNLIFYFE
uniref:Co-chaperonin GroES n=1 Tax=Lactuca sativa TaxID=4236 RepID=A0A9R1XNR3_LACSA|nr:hypothetical protein LSAT_V11C400207830 [Lactuca sativa]